MTRIEFDKMERVKRKWDNYVNRLNVREACKRLKNDDFEKKYYGSEERALGCLYDCFCSEFGEPVKARKIFEEIYAEIKKNNLKHYDFSTFSNSLTEWVGCHSPDEIKSCKRKWEDFNESLALHDNFAAYFLNYISEGGLSDVFGFHLRHSSDAQKRAEDVSIRAIHRDFAVWFLDRALERGSSFSSDVHNAERTRKTILNKPVAKTKRFGR